MKTMEKIPSDPSLIQSGKRTRESEEILWTHSSGGLQMERNKSLERLGRGVSTRMLMAAGKVGHRQADAGFITNHWVVCEMSLKLQLFVG